MVTQTFRGLLFQDHILNHMQNIFINGSLFFSILLTQRVCVDCLLVFLISRINIANVVDITLFF